MLKQSSHNRKTSNWDGQKKHKRDKSG